MKVFIAVDMFTDTIQSVRGTLYALSRTMRSRTVEVKMSVILQEHELYANVW